MVNKTTFTISRIEIRHMLLSFGVSEKNIQTALSSMEKTHRHINIIAFISLLEGYGLDKDQITQLLRRIGLDDTRINEAVEMVDEHKIVSEAGKLFYATLDT
jgi:uncharacterized protein Smg (DUF494 family)